MNSRRIRASPIKRATGRLSRYGSWIACCLSRGTRAPLGPDDIDELVSEFGEYHYARGTLGLGTLVGDIAS